MRTLVVTGATGYVGRALVGAARSRGWRVVAASRRPCEDADAWIGYDLAIAPAALPWPHAAPIVHLAAATRETMAPEDEIAAAGALLEAARSRGAVVVFLSSQVARADAPTPYGRTKHAIERLVLAAGGIVVRPGLVWGGVPGGVYAKLVSAARRAPVWPAIVPAPRLQPVHVDDLAAAVLRVVQAPEAFRGRVLHVGEHEPVPFDAWMQALAAAHSRTLHAFPVPAAFVRAGAAVAQRCGAAELGTRARSLLAIPPMEVRADVDELGLAVRSSRDAFATRARARAVLREGAALLRYVLAERPALPLVRRYARAVRSLHGGAPLPLSRTWLALPPLLRMLDQPRVRDADAAWRQRIQLAVAIAEASPQGARRFLAATGDRGRAARLVAAVVTLLPELAARVASSIFARALRR